VQRLRSKALAEGNLKSGKEQKITTDQEAGTTVIKIEPTNPEVVYVPVYNPTVVYGVWPYPAYPPYYYYPPLCAACLRVLGGHRHRQRSGAAATGVAATLHQSQHLQQLQWTNISSGDWQHKPEDRKGGSIATRAVATARRPAA
jgi:hypothetical protein